MENAEIHVVDIRTEYVDDLNSSHILLFAAWFFVINQYR